MPAIAADMCDEATILISGCPEVTGTITDDGVEIVAEQTRPGSGNGPGSAAGNGNDNASGNNSGTGTGTPATTVPRAIQPGEPGYRDPYTVTSPVTLSDLVNFRPAPGVDHMEPDGWMIVGLDTNFYARANVQVQSGVLLAQQASVRFTPVRYHWEYGDGARASRATPGETWRASGLAEFDRTPTSHVYRVAGTYFIDLTIDFAAEYRYAGGSWTSIAGVIPVPANRLVAAAGGAKTVLVEQECTLNPYGPGC